MGEVFCEVTAKNQPAMALSALFGKRKTPEEMLRQNQRALTKVISVLVCKKTLISFGTADVI